MILRRSLLVSVFAGLLVLPAACGGGDGTGTRSASGERGGSERDPSHLTVIAGDVFVKPKDATVPAGRVQVTYVNEGQIMHTLVVQGNKDLKLLVEEKGEEDTGSVELQPGDYNFYCDVPGHRSAGMELEVHVQ
jgi:plastocyanin